MIKLTWIAIEDIVFSLENFQTDDFLALVNKKLEEWGTSCKAISEGLSIITSYQDWQELDLDSQIKVARTIVAINARAIIEWEHATHQEMSELDDNDRLNLAQFTQTQGDFSVKTRELLEEITQEVNSEAKEIHSVKWTDLTLYMKLDDGEVFFYLVWNNERYGVTVNSSWSPLRELNNNDYFYFFVPVWENIEIWYWSIHNWFNIQYKAKWLKVEEVAIVQEGYLAFMRDNIFIVIDLESGEEIYSLPKSQCSWPMESGEVIEIHERWNKRLLIYRGYNNEGSESYVVTDPNTDEEGFYSKFPVYPVITENSIYLILYSPEANLYWIWDLESITCGTIHAFIDEEDNYYINWSLPKNIQYPNGNCCIRFVYTTEDKKWKEVYEIWYIMDWIYWDDISTKKKRDKNIALVQAVNELPI